MISAVSSATQGIMNSMRRVARAAQSIATAGSPETRVGPDNPAPGAGPTDSSGAADLSGAMVDLLMAQRAFSAQLRVLRTADEMARETIDLLGR